MPPTRATAKQSAAPALPTKPLAEWTYGDAVAAVNAVAESRIDAASYAANERYLAGDHWQDGETWVGPRGTDETWPLVRDAVARQFTPAGVIGEVLERVANGLLKREASLTFAPLSGATAPELPATPTPEQRAAYEEAKRVWDDVEREATAMAGLVSHWWDRVTLWEHARTAVMQGRALTRGVLYLSIAEGDLERDGDTTRLPADLDPADAFARVQLTAADPAACALLEEPRTRRAVAVVLFDDGTGPAGKRAELWTMGAIDPLARDIMQAAGDAPDRLTRRILREDAKPQDYTLTWNRLPVAELRAPLLITEAVRRQQARLDFGESMLVRGMETAGFRERYIINAEPQGYWLDTDEGNAIEVRQFDDGVTRYKYAEVRTLGAAVTNELIGIVVGGDGDDAKRATPSVTFADPVDPDYAIKANEHARAVILMSCRQGHVMANGDAAPSGYSREQARADFEDDLAATKAPLEGALRATIEAAVAYALAMASDTGLREAGIGRDFLDRFRAVVTCEADSGPLSPDERRAILEELKSGARSRRSAMAALGVEDVEAEIRLLEGEEAAKLARLKLVAEVLNDFADRGSYEGGVRLLERLGVLDAAEATALVPRDTDGAEPAEPVGVAA